MKVLVQTKNLERLETTNRGHRGAGGLVGIGGLGDNNNREGDKVEGTYFCPSGELCEKGAKKVPLRRLSLATKQTKVRIEIHG